MSELAKPGIGQSDATRLLAVVATIANQESEDACSSLPSNTYEPCDGKKSPP